MAYPSRVVLQWCGAVGCCSDVLECGFEIAEATHAALSCVDIVRQSCCAGRDRSLLDGSILLKLVENFYAKRRLEHLLVRADRETLCLRIAQIGLENPSRAD